MFWIQLKWSQTFFKLSGRKTLKIEISNKIIVTLKMNEGQEPVFHKVTVVGDSGVGKTSIVHRACFDKFSTDLSPTIGSACLKKTVETPHGPISMNIWDTAGQERFQSLIPMYLKGSKACIFVVDLSNPINFSDLSSYYDYISDQLEDGCFLWICGNKLDLIPPDFDLTPLQRWANQRNCKSYKVSAKTGFGIDELFQEIALQIALNYDPTDEYGTRKLSSKTKKNGCC